VEESGVKREIVLTVSLSLIILITNGTLSGNKEFSLYEEDKSLWNELLKDTSIKNRNLLNASYVAYKESLHDLSIETLKECIKNNPSNDLIFCIATYYIGKNLFSSGQYREAITQFTLASSSNFGDLSEIKFGLLINTAIAYHRINDLRNFEEYLQRVIRGDRDGKFGKIAQGLLSQSK
jgi:tetratricopeptide (TPR) repeat protein